VGKRQLGFGWGKGRRVIKTIIAGEALTRALAKQQTWVDRHRALVEELQDTLHAEPDQRGSVTTQVVSTDCHPSTSALSPHPTKLRMAKARLRSARR